MKYTNGFSKLGLPDYFKFGIELEANNIRTKGKESLYSGQSADYIKSKNWHMATKYEESLVGKGGAELVYYLYYQILNRLGKILQIYVHK